MWTLRQRRPEVHRQRETALGILVVAFGKGKVEAGPGR
jgi:hypothetical protein